MVIIHMGRSDAFEHGFSQIPTDDTGAGPTLTSDLC